MPDFPLLGEPISTPLIVTRKTSAQIGDNPSVGTPTGAFRTSFESLQLVLIGQPVQMKQSTDQTVLPEHCVTSAISNMQRTSYYGASVSKSAAHSGPVVAGDSLKKRQIVATTRSLKYTGVPQSRATNDLQLSPAGTLFDSSSLVWSSYSPHPVTGANQGLSFHAAVPGSLIPLGASSIPVEEKQTCQAPSDTTANSVFAYPRDRIPSTDKAAQSVKPISGVSLPTRMHASPADTSIVGEDASDPLSTKVDQKLDFRNLVRSGGNALDYFEAPNSKKDGNEIVTNSLHSDSVLMNPTEKEKQMRATPTADKGLLDTLNADSVVEAHPSRSLEEAGVRATKMTSALSGSRGSSASNRSLSTIKSDLGMSPEIMVVANVHTGNALQQPSNGQMLSQILANGHQHPLFDPFSQMDRFKTLATIRASPSLRALDASLDTSVQGVSGIRVELVAGGINASMQTVSSGSIATLVSELEPMHGFLLDNNISLSNLVIDHGSTGQGHSSQTSPNESTEPSVLNHPDHSSESVQSISEIETHGLIDVHA